MRSEIALRVAADRLPSNGGDQDFGVEPEGSQLVPFLTEESAFFDMAEYLLAPDARWLEQEVIDPEPVGLEDSDFADDAG